MIVKNEEKTLKRCLSSCKNLFDEIIIVDTGSTDNTIKIAKYYTNKIYNFKWQNNFSKARNFAFSKASGQYLMWLDADDVIPRNSLKELLKLKSNLSADVYMLKYNIAFFNGKPTFSYFRERIIKNCKQAVWDGVVHECITPFGKVEKLNISINHKKEKPSDPNRNLDIYKQLIKTRELLPREQYYYGRELYDHKQYKKCIKILHNFIASKNGWIENVIDAHYLISNCYMFLNNSEKHLQSLMQTFMYDTPRANIVCKIGDYFLQSKKYMVAIFWYNMATICQDTENGGFVEPMYYNYYPYLQTCYCYYCLGNNEKAYTFNQKAKKYCKSEQVLNNEQYFKSILNKQ